MTKQRLTMAAVQQVGAYLLLLHIIILLLETALSIVVED